MVNNFILQKYKLTLVIVHISSVYTGISSFIKLI